MRLRLEIRRHGLPETFVIWTVDSTSTTVAQLLQHVNEAIPVEAGEWGFEDYVVEVKGLNAVNYECLHYQSVKNVMKDEDEVIIRPLLTQDLKIQKISGRHQISADGKHLIDGLAYGRPLLRRPADRPSINIPPRKRARISYSGNDDDESEVKGIQEGEIEESGDDNKQVVLHVDFDDESDEDDEDFEAPTSDEDEEFEAPASDEDDDLEDESEKDFEEASQEKNELFSGVELKVDADAKSKEGEALADVQDETTRNKIRQLHSAFPHSALALCKYVLKLSKNDVGDAYEALARGFSFAKPKKAITEIFSEDSSLPELETRPQPKSPMKSIRKSRKDDAMEVDAKESEQALVGHYDHRGLPPGFIKTANASSVIKGGAPDLRSFSPKLRNESDVFPMGAGHDSTPIRSQESSDDSDISTSEEEFTSSDLVTGDDSLEEHRQIPQNVNISDTSSSQSSESESSGSQSEDDSPEEITSKSLEPLISKLQSTKPKIQKQISDDVPRGKGNKATRSRNRRRRLANVLDRFKKKGILPANTTTAEFRRLEEVESGTSPETASVALNALRALNVHHDGVEEIDCASGKSDEFELRRQRLLASIASGGIEVDAQSPEVPPARSTTPKTLASKGATTTNIEPVQALESSHTFSGDLQTTSIPVQMDTNQQTAASFDSQSPGALEAAAHVIPIETQPDSSPLPQSTASRRTKLDLGAGRRLLFGALGLKNPKTKDDEENVRHTLMKDVRPIKLPKNHAEIVEEVEVANDEEPEAWRQRIIYRAVECIQEGINLSEPPFPFIQRWDPQQKRSVKGKDQRQQAKYYHDDPRASKKQRQWAGTSNYTEEQENHDILDPVSDQIASTATKSPRSISIQRDDVSYDKINQQLVNNTQPLEDLPPLPKDLKSLPNLLDGQARLGMTIAFQKLELSAATQWQPQISSYLTAIVTATPEKGVLQLALAKRDRATPTKIYDEETGERVYNKFDVPDSDEDAEYVDDGILELPYYELVEPKIVSEPPGTIGAGIDKDIQTTSNNSIIIGEQVIQSTGQIHTEAQVSQVPDTPLQSDAGAPIQTGEGYAQTVQQQVSEVEAAGRRPLEKKISAVEAACSDPGTPLAKAAALTAQNSLLDSMSEDTRQKISHMIRDAGFRSSIPSVIGGETPMQGMETPDEKALFEKLIKEMTEENSSMYSPKFNGLDPGSPTEHQRPSDSILDLASPAMGTQSSWMTIEKESEMEEPLDKELAYEGHLTSAPEPENEGATARHRRKGKQGIRKQPVAKVPVAGAQAMWESSQPMSLGLRPSSVADSPEFSLRSDLGLDGAEDKGLDANVLYPKLSIGSSLHSQITDHGRQPDFSFEDSTAITISPPKNAEIEVAAAEPEGSRRMNRSNLMAMQQSNNTVESNSEPHRREPKPEDVKILLEPASHVPDPFSDSDDAFPTLEEVFSQPSLKGKQKSLSSTKGASKKDKSHETAMETLNEKSHEADSALPERSESDGIAARIPASQSRKSDSIGSQSHASQAITSKAQQSNQSSSQSQFEIPEGSQIMDLTISSDAEVKLQQNDKEDSEGSDFGIFKSYDHDDLNDEGSAGSPGWAPKKNSALQGMGTRRKTRNGLRTSSQSSINKRKKRKTTTGS